MTRLIFEQKKRLLTLPRGGAISLDDVALGLGMLTPFVTPLPRELAWLIAGACALAFVWQLVTLHAPRSIELTENHVSFASYLMAMAPAIILIIPSATSSWINRTRKAEQR